MPAQERRKLLTVLDKYYKLIRHVKDMQLFDILNYVTVIVLISDDTTNLIDRAPIKKRILYKGHLEPLRSVINQRVTRSVSVTSVI